MEYLYVVVVSDYRNVTLDFTNLLYLDSGYNRKIYIYFKQCINMADKSYIQIGTDEGLIYEGKGSINGVSGGDWRQKVNDGKLNKPWYGLLEIKHVDKDKLRISQGIAFEEDHYILGNILSKHDISCTQCSLSFLEMIVKSFREEK